MIRRSRISDCSQDGEPGRQEPLHQQAQALDLLPVLVCDERDGIIYWSQGAQLLYGFAPEGALGHRSCQLLQTELPEPLEHIRNRMRGGRPWHGELVQVRKDGSGIYVASQWVPSRDPHTGLPTIIEVNTDITQHHLAEVVHGQLAAIVESSEDAIIGKNLDGVITTWNAAAERLFGYRAHEAIGRPGSLIIPPELQAEEAGILERLRAGEHLESFETVRLTKAGRRLDVFLTISPVRGASGRIIGSSKIVRDISQRKSREAAARLACEVAHRRQVEQREQILMAMMEHIPLGIAIADTPDVTIRMVSRHGRRLLQKPRAAIVGTPAELHPATLAFFHPDGRPALPEELPLTRATRQGEIIKQEEWVVARRDGVRIPILCTAAPIRDPRGRIVGGVIGWQDLTRRKQTEKALQKAQAELQAHAETLEKAVAERTGRLRETVAELEAFSYSISHDIRAPIRAIHGFAEVALLRHRSHAPPLTLDLLRRILVASETADHFIQDLLTLVRTSHQHIGLAPVNLEKLVHEVIQERSEFQAAGAEITLESPLLPVLGHEPSLRQCLINLLGNASKFVAPGVQPRIRIRTEPRFQSDAAGVLTHLVRLWVEDNGIGIAPEAQARVFDLLHRAQHPQKYEGTGLGLAIVKKAVERMCGHVGVESSPGQGSRFWIDLGTVPE